jgi:glycosyltransferase involved in cell wall biosynthesis
MQPDQGQHRVIQAFHVLKTYLRRDAHLVLVGPAGDAGYIGSLNRFVLELFLPGVDFATDLNDAQIAFVYRRADVVISMALGGHVAPELIEAIGFGVPILARGSVAMRELVARAGVVIDDLEPVLAAEALERILADSSLRRRLKAGSRRRAAELARGGSPTGSPAEVQPA